MQGKKSTIFGQAFDITDEKLASMQTGAREQNTPAMEALAAAMPEMVADLRNEMREDGLCVDGRVIGAGTIAYVFNTASCRNPNGTERDTPAEIPGAITRIESIEKFDHPIVMLPAFKKSYTPLEYQVHVVPFAPDNPEMPVSYDDIKRTLGVLKADNSLHRIYDIEKTNFVFLKKDDGDVIRYPNSPDTPENYRNKPIAFIRDLNSIPKDFGKSGIPSVADSWLKTHVDMRVDDLPAAPRECVEACKQQYEFTRKLAHELQQAGIEPNVPIPEVTAPGTAKITGAEPANQQAIDQSKQHENGHE